MPQITDPVMLAKIKAKTQLQTPMQPQTLAGPATGLPNGVNLVPRTNTLGQQLDDARKAGLLPLEIKEKAANARKAQIEADNLAGIPWNEDTINFVAQGLAGGAKITDLTGGFGMGTAGRINQTRALERLTEIQGAKGLHGEDQARQIAHYKAGSAALANLEKQYGTVQGNETTTRGNIENYLNLSQELPWQTGSPTANKVIQWLQKEIPGLPGHDQVPEMQAAGVTGLNEYARLMSGAPSGAGVLSDASRQEAREIMLGNYSKEQKQAVWQLMQADMANRIKGYRSALDEGYVNLTKTPGYQVPGDVTALGHGIAPTPQEVFDQNAKLIHGIYQNAGTGATQPGEMKLSTTEQAKPFPLGYQEEHNAFLNEHRGKLTVQDYVAFRKQMDAKYGMEEGDLNTPETEKFVRDINEGRTSTAIPALNRPLSADESLAAKISQNPAATLLENFANSATMGLPELASSQEKRDVFHAANEANAPEAFVGDAAGSVLPITGLSKAGAASLAKLGMTPEKIATLFGGSLRANAAGNVAANTVYGGIRGFNSADDGQGAEGALGGAAAGAVGGVVGEVATRGAVPLLSGRTIAALQKMKGVDLTTLQRLGLGSEEGAISGVPFAHGSQQKALTSYNLNEAKKALEPILRYDNSLAIPKGVAAGTEVNAHVDKAASDFYDTIKPHIVGSVDGKFNSALKVYKAAADTPIKKQMFAEIQSAVNSLKDANGHFDGNSYKEASAKLRELVDAFSNDTTNPVAAGQMARVADGIRKQIKALVKRQVPEDVANRLNAVEKTWSMKMVNEDATRRALAQNAGVYSPSQRLTSIKSLDTSKNKGFSARGTASGQKDAMAAQEIMGPGTVPAKASLKDMAYALGTLGGTGYATHGVVPSVVIPAGIAAYAPGVKRITQKVLSRPSAIEGKKTIVNNKASRAAIADAMRKLLMGGK